MVGILLSYPIKHLEMKSYRRSVKEFDKDITEMRKDKRKARIKALIYFLILLACLAFVAREILK